MRADLHVHTTASDGRVTPDKIVERAASLNLPFIAITDHDTVAGVAAAVKAALTTQPQVIVIPGVEINTDVPHGEVHILGYFINVDNKGLLQTLQRLRTSREKRGDAMVAKLRALGVNIEWPRVQELAGGGSIGRPHVAEALLEKHYVSSIKEAFDKYIGREGPAYVEREKITPQDAVKLVLQAGGLPVLAHPAEIHDFDRLLPSLIEAGLVGIEVWYGSYSRETVNRIKSVAASRHLIATGGSDFHGFGDSETPLGAVNVPVSALRQLFERAGKGNLLRDH